MATTPSIESLRTTAADQVSELVVDQAAKSGDAFTIMAGNIVSNVVGKATAALAPITTRNLGLVRIAQVGGEGGLIYLGAFNTWFRCSTLN